MNYFTHEDDRPVYFNMSCGALTTKPKNGEPQSGKSQFGNLIAVFYYWDDYADPAKNIKPGYRAEIHLRNPGNEQKDVAPYTAVIRAKAPQTATWMLASYLPNVKPGDMVRIEVSGGSENEKVTTVFLKRPDANGAWVNVPRVEMPADLTQRHEKAEALYRTHPAFTERGASPAKVTKDEEEYDPFAEE